MKPCRSEERIPTGQQLHDLLHVEIGLAPLKRAHASLLTAKVAKVLIREVASPKCADESPRSVACSESTAAVAELGKEWECKAVLPQ